jgi:DNA polymerase I
LKTDSKTMKAMYHVPGIEQIHGLRDAIRVFSSSIPIGRDGRNRPSVFPFGTRTGRNAHRKSLFNCHAGLRSFMRFPEDSVPVYLDWRSQEPGVAAAFSGDARLIEAYRRGDIYHALAVLCGLTNDPDPVHWKKHNPEVRQRMKTLQLGINYGMSVASLSRGLERHNLIGSVIIDRYARTYPDYWSWRQRTVNKAMVRRRIVAPQG